MNLSNKTTLPSWEVITAYLRSGDNTVLEVGIYFNFQTGMLLKYFGTNISGE